MLHVLSWIAGAFVVIFGIGAALFSDSPDLRATCQWLAAGSLLSAVGFGGAFGRVVSIAAFVLAGACTICAIVCFFNAASAEPPKSGG